MTQQRCVTHRPPKRMFQQVHKIAQRDERMTKQRCVTGYITPPQRMFQLGQRMAQQGQLMTQQRGFTVYISPHGRNNAPTEPATRPTRPKNGLTRSIAVCIIRSSTPKDAPTGPWNDPTRPMNAPTKMHHCLHQPPRLQKYSNRGNRWLNTTR